MKPIFRITFLLLSFFLNACSTPIHNSKTETYKVLGNCEKCQKNIETAAYKKGESKAEWNKDTKIVSLTFDSTKTNADAMLKRIAYSGYDNEKYLAPDEAYSKLDECCQYDRQKKESIGAGTEKANTIATYGKTIYTCPMHPEVQSDKPGKCPKCGMTLVKKENTEVASINVQASEGKTGETEQSANPLSEVYAAYFGVKDALTKDDGKGASNKSSDLFSAIAAVQMDKLKTEQHSIWMKYMEKLSYDAEHIKSTTDTEHQREHFASLSKNMHEVMMVIKANYTVYYDHCPMYNSGKGADWLSKETAIKNPFFGSQMIGCGRTKETIK